MQIIRSGYRGLSLLVDLNWDRLFALVALTLALLLGAWIASQSGFMPVVERI